MAANGSVIELGPHTLIPLNGPVSQPRLLAMSSTAGVLLTNGDSYGFGAVRKCPYSTLTTGLTFDLMVTDDGSDATDLGKAVVLGVTVKKLVSGTDTLDIGTDAATEATTTITLDATSGQVVTGSVAITSLDSITAGDWMLIRIRRVGSHVSDTANGPAVLVGAAGYAY